MPSIVNKYASTRRRDDELSAHHREYTMLIHTLDRKDGQSYRFKASLH